MLYGCHEIVMCECGMYHCIPVVSETKLLGLVFERNLFFKSPITYLTKEVVERRQLVTCGCVK
jgi:hypothetical protein